MNHIQNTISSKLPNTGTSVFAIMTRLANQHNALNLSQGFPDFAISKELINLVAKHMRAGHNQYAPMPGVLLLRERIAFKTNLLYGAVYNPDTEVTVTAGATQALFGAITAFVRDGDEVIVFEPAYDSYVPAIKLAGGTTVAIKLKAPTYHIDWDEVKKMVSARTKMIIINSPHNPTGSILSAADLKTLESITRDTGIIVLSDEVYEHLVFDGKSHESVCKYPGLAERSLVTCSFGKTFHATGWKTGYCIGPDYLMKEFRKVHQFMVFCTNTPVQMAICDFLENPDNYTGLNWLFQSKRDFFLKALKSSRFEFVSAAGTYFQLLDYSKISDEPEMEFAQRLTRTHKIASVPIAPFYSHGVNNKKLRFCFAKSEETLEKAASILCKI